MAFRRVYRKDLWSFNREWRSASTAGTALRSAARCAGSELNLPLISKSSIVAVPFKALQEGRSSLSIALGIKGCFFTTQTLADLPVGSGLVEVPLAQTGEGIAECELLKWFVSEGDEVEEFQPLCEVQSDKATMEITSRYKGKVSELLHVPGNIVKVGETLLRLVVAEVGFPAVSELESNAAVSELACSKISKVLSTPAVRGYAKRLGVNIEDVPGTGKDGRVLKEDVLNYAAPHEHISKESSSASTETFLGGDSLFREVPQADEFQFEDRTVTLRGFHRAMAKSMTLAGRIPHFYFVDEIDCGSLIELKQSFQTDNSDPGLKHSFLPLLIKSLSLALTKYPLLNSSFNEELQEVTLKGSHNVGIAMATPNGLVVPNIKRVQSLSILQITKELSRLQQLALANKLSPDDISGGTITLSNIGSIGGKFGTPLVNIPEVSIIALGRVQKIPRFDNDGEVYPASIMTVSIGSDHRVLDGATVARFCSEWKQFIEKPELLLLHLR